MIKDFLHYVYAAEADISDIDISKWKYDNGYDARFTIRLFNKDWSITAVAQAYYEKDGITPEQTNAWKTFVSNTPTLLKKIEKALLSFDRSAAKRFAPRSLDIQRNGITALLCDDATYPDNGIAVTILPTVKVQDQDSYL